MKNNIAITILISLLAGAGGFFAGMKYQQIHRFAGGRQFMTTNRPGVMTNRMGIRPVTGEIISIDGNSITVKMPDGSSRIVLISEKTVINKAQATTRDELKPGEKVAAFGQENADGSITATNIQMGD